MRSVAETEKMQAGGRQNTLSPSLSLSLSRIYLLKMIKNSSVTSIGMELRILNMKIMHTTIFYSVIVIATKIFKKKVS